MSGSDEQDPVDPKTVFAPFNPAASAIPVPPPSPEPTAAAPEPAAAPQRPADPAPPPAQAPAAPPAGGQIKIGDVLNHIYEVRRFIARGGMGEVYEGINVNNPDERVAIKVILPALAADPNVQAMFRKEATTLTRLSHRSLVTYRLLAQEPRLGVLYIVTEYIDGTNLSDVLGKVPRDAANLRALTRMLADGLRVAHELGAVHRDISPDNVILEGGDIGNPRIIDFGIAKDLDPGKATIVGDGFAGKLAFVAPEQLGDFGRNVGPWSDVYSLGLVILAVALGRNADMGATLVEAVDKRRAGVDVSGAPEALQPVLQAMLAPDPAQRLRSMSEVIAALDRVQAAPAPTSPPQTGTGRAKPAADKPAGPSGPGLLDKVMAFVRARPLPVAGGALAAVALIAAVGMFGGGDDDSAAQPAATAALSPQDAAQQTMASLLPGLECTWLDMEAPTLADGNLSVTFRGVAGNSATAQKAISDALSKAGLKVAAINFENVSPAPLSVCPLLDAYRPIKSRRAGEIASDQPKYERELQPADSSNAGQIAAVPQIHLSPDVMRSNLVLGGIDPDPGATAAIFVHSRDELQQALSNQGAGTINPDGSATLKIAQNLDGLVGVLVVFSSQALQPELIVPPPQSRTSAWRDQFLSVARQNGWQADMVWFRIANEVPDAPAGAASGAAAITPSAG